MRFTFINPTKIIFGSGSLSRLGDAVSAYGTRALLVTGGGSVKHNGTFDRAAASLHAAGVSIVEYAGIEANPRISSITQGEQTARKHNCDVVIGLGGGSTMDAAKAIAAAVCYDGDPWDLINYGQQSYHRPTQALPIITVPTLAATGSEMNNGAVITNDITVEKASMFAECLYPRTAVIDPELTITVPPDQTAYGISDLIAHVTESYFNGVDGTPLQDRFAEGVVLTALEWGPKVVTDGNNIEARTQIQWASVVALNGWLQIGTRAPYPVHAIEHTLSAHHDVAHGAGLAVVNPAWMRFAATKEAAKFAQFARRVMKVTSDNRNEEDIACEGIDRFSAFLASLGCPTRLSELDIDETLLQRYAEDAIRIANHKKTLPGRPPLHTDDIVTILRSVL